MDAIIQPVDRVLIKKELTEDKFIRKTRKGDNYIFEVTAADSPMIMQEIGRLREISFRMSQDERIAIILQPLYHLVHVADRMTPAIFNQDVFSF